MAESFSAKNLGLRAQKKILGKMASKNIAKMFIDDTAGGVLDCLYRITKEYTGSKKEGEKMLKHIIKIVIKIGVLHRNNQFSSAELSVAESFKKKFNFTAKTAISFHEVDFSFDKHFLSKQLNDCRNLVKDLVRQHLTDKSMARIDTVFNFYGRPEFLEAVYRPNSAYSDWMSSMIKGMDKMMEEGGL